MIVTEVVHRVRNWEPNKGMIAEELGIGSSLHNHCTVMVPLDRSFVHSRDGFVRLSPHVTVRLFVLDRVVEQCGHPLPGVEYN